MQGSYRPELLPGYAPSRPDVDTSRHTPRPGTGLAGIESRLHAIRSRSKVAALEPELKAFLDVDVEHLLRIAHAAHRTAHATNAESHREALGALHAIVRQR